LDKNTRWVWIRSYLIKMKNKIKTILKNIEKDKKIKIIFAVESGSRSWGMESINSDYDVRFVFVRPIEQYISINNQQML